MPGFSSYTQLLASVNAGNSFRAQFSKLNNSGIDVGGWSSLWNVSGTPPSGPYGTTLTARQVDNTSSGAIYLPDAPTGSGNYLLSVGMYSSSAPGVLILVDRLLEAPFSGGTTVGVFNGGTPVTIPSRDMNGSPSGEGLVMFIENTSTTSVGAVSRNIQVVYTNSQGVVGRTTPLMASVSTNTTPGSNQSGQHGILTLDAMFLHLQDGDTGVQAVSGYTLSGPLGATNLNIVVCRPIAWIPLNTANTGQWLERDMVLQTGRMPRIYNGSALGFIVLDGGNTGAIHGHLSILRN